MSKCRRARTHNSTNHDTPFIEKDYCGRSIVFAAKELVFDSGKNNGVVCAVYEKATVKKKIVILFVSKNDSSGVCVAARSMTE